ncbi:MAG: CRTAC1 family protein [Acidobacteria bacterium]|nr:CRTAC1 family protein [Acidobacteriota bacterium]
MIKWIDQAGVHFYKAGAEIVGTLNLLASSLRSKDMSRIREFYSPRFRGSSLGLTSPRLAEEKDGICRFRLQSDSKPLDCSGALAEWYAYLDSFEAIEEVGLHIHRLEEWKARSQKTATIRFELIGKPKGSPRFGIDRAYFRWKFQVTEDRLQISESSLIEGDRSIGNRRFFTDVAGEAGIDFENQYYPPFLNQPLWFGMIRYGPAGITAVDYDNDGYYDLFIPDGVESKLFRNRGDGTFEDVTAAAGLSGLDGVSVAVFADYDNDGYKDLFVSRTFQPNQLFHNNGDGTFTDVTKEAGIGEDSCTTVASWADYDNDGYLDLYVGRYLDPRKCIPTTFYARNGEPNQLYHNNGDGTFTNVTHKAGVGEIGLCLGTVWGDYDDDGYPDLYVVNDFGRNTLYHNNGDGTFTDVTIRTNTLAYGAGMNASIADYNNDGKLDIYVTNIRSEEAWFAEAPTVRRYILNSFRQGVWKTDMPLYFEMFRQSGFGFVGIFQQMASGNTLLRNKGDGTFEDVTWAAGANPVGWFWGASFADFDNDGWQDIYMADGWVYNDPGTEIEMEFLNNVVSRQNEYKTGIFFDPKHFGRNSWHGHERNRYLRNNGDGTFVEIGRATGTDLLLNSRGVAVADFWNRGVLDIAISASGDRHALLKNEIGQKRNWLAVELIGTKSNRDAVGARITIHVKGQLQMREVVLGDGYGSQNTLRQHFGLNEEGMVDEIIVKWPRSGITQRFQNIAANRIVEITEGSDTLAEKVYSKVYSRSAQ